jgi:branched-chain amino acid transport system permease protein
MNPPDEPVALTAAQSWQGHFRDHLVPLVDAATRYRVLIAVAFLAIFPWFAPYEALAVNILVFGLFALGYNLIYGYTGMLSFGHAALFGLGAYGCGVPLAKYGWHWLPAIGLGIVTASIGAAVIGWFATRTRGIYFAMVTLAAAQVIYYIAFQWLSMTGGEDGLRGVNVGVINVLGLQLNILDPTSKYYAILVIVAIALWLFSRILQSPFGAVLEAIRENETRAAACGYDVRRTRLLAFTLSGLFSGLAGALYAIHLSVVPIETLHYFTSATVLMMTLLGGMGTFFGPFLGAFVYLLLADIITVVTVHWQLFVGALFVFLILFFPRGIWGSLMHWVER